jgi:hypothetical protein
MTSMRTQAFACALSADPRTRRRDPAVAISILLAALALAGCSQTPPPYATAYQSALARYPGSTPVDSRAIDRFVAFFSHDGSPDDQESSQHSSATVSPTAAELYADRFYFSDTLVTTETPRHGAGTPRAHALDHRQPSRSRCSTGSMTAPTSIWCGTCAPRFAPVRSTVTSDTIGITHLRFDSDGRIVLHQDFWDASEGLYQHVPVLGSVIHRIRRSFDHANDPRATDSCLRGNPGLLRLGWSGATDAATAARELHFDVFFDDKRIGDHRFHLTPGEDALRVRSEADFEYRLLFVPVYRYRHEAEEIWQDGCLRNSPPRPTTTAATSKSPSSAGQ